MPPTVQAQQRSPELDRQFFRAQTAWERGMSPFEAKARVDQVLHQLPNDAAARVLRAQVLLRLDQPERALEDALVAVQLRPQDPEGYVLVCEAARRAGQLDLAHSALEDGSRLTIDDAALNIQLSWNALHLGEHSKAEALARAALAMDDSQPGAYYQLARVFVEQEQHTEAALILQRGLSAFLLDRSFIAADPDLQDLLQHPSLRTADDR